MLSYTPREFKIMLRSQQERKMDDYETMAHAAMMNRQAQHAERLTLTDLYKRPVDAEEAQAKTEELVDKTVHANEWLSQFTNFSGVSVGKE